VPINLTLKKLERERRARGEREESERERVKNVNSSSSFAGVNPNKTFLLKKNECYMTFKYWSYKNIQN